LKNVVNLRALELSFWHSGQSSFYPLGESIGKLAQLQYLSLSQSFIYPFGYTFENDRMDDNVFSHIAKHCANLKDVHLSSFYAVTNVTWEAFAQYCHNIRSFSIEDCGLGIDVASATALVKISPSTLRYLAILPRFVGNISSYLPQAGLAYVTDEAVDVITKFRMSFASDVVIFTRRDPVRHRSVMLINVVPPQRGAQLSSSTPATAPAHAPAPAPAGSASSSASGVTLPPVDSTLSSSLSADALQEDVTGVAAAQGTNSMSLWPVAYDMSKMSPCNDLKSLFGVLIDGGTSGEAYYKHLVSIGHMAAFRMYMDQQLLPFSYFQNYQQYK
jgi:hypothetical protein